MREEEFGDYMQGCGYKAFKGWVAYARKIERHFSCDLDQEYSQNGMNSIQQQARHLLPKESSVIPHYRNFCMAFPLQVSGSNTPGSNQVSPSSTSIPNPPNKPPCGNVPPNCFWDPSNFSPADPVNLIIWSWSPIVQKRLIKCCGQKVGGQQGMPKAPHRAFFPLPWVPDIVGQQYGNNNKDASVLVLGSAYAGFLKGYNAGRNNVEPIQYCNCPNYWAFSQGQFIPNVVGAIPSNPSTCTGCDRMYYLQIAKLLTNAHIPPAHIALGDLCRASFVEKSSSAGIRDDTCGDSVCTSNRSAYNAYVRANDAWTWKRIMNSRRIVALGALAEIGILRLFQQKLSKPIIEIRNSMATHTLNPSFANMITGAAWVQGSAQWRASVCIPVKGFVPLHKKRITVLDYFVHTQSHWSIRDNDDEWRVLPMWHPSAQRTQSSIAFNQHYNKAAQLLSTL